jgi:hypothetical protein
LQRGPSDSYLRTPEPVLVPTENEEEEDFPHPDNEDEPPDNEDREDQEDETVEAIPHVAMTNEGGNTHWVQGAPESFKTRSGRTVKVSSKVLDSSEKLGSINPDYSTRLAITHLCSYLTAMLDDRTPIEFHPLAYTASLADKDTFHLAEAMKQPDWDEFVKAMENEIQDHTQHKHWSIHTRSQLRKIGYKDHVIMAVWSFKRKRNPFGVITKYKARLCVHGGQTQKGVLLQFRSLVDYSTTSTNTHVHPWLALKANRLYTGLPTSWYPYYAVYGAT